MSIALWWLLFSAMMLIGTHGWASELPILLDESRMRRRSQLHLQAVHTLLIPTAERVALRCRPVRETTLFLFGCLFNGLQCCRHVLFVLVKTEGDDAVLMLRCLRDRVA
jgi:hypothetical protein